MKTRMIALHSWQTYFSSFAELEISISAPHSLQVILSPSGYGMRNLLRLLNSLYLLHRLIRQPHTLYAVVVVVVLDVVVVVVELVVVGLVSSRTFTTSHSGNLYFLSDSALQ